MTTQEDKDKVRIEFAPGAFDDFDGTQEELDELISELEQKIEDGTLFEESEPLDLEELAEEDPVKFLEIADHLGIVEDILAEIDDKDERNTVQEVLDAIRGQKKKTLN